MEAVLDKIISELMCTDTERIRTVSSRHLFSVQLKLSCGIIAKIGDAFQAYPFSIVIELRKLYCF